MARVCLITHVVAPWDGQGRVNYELTRHLLRQGHAVSLVATLVEPSLREAPGIEWLRIPVPRWLPDLLGWGVFALLARIRIGSFRRRAYDIVHLNGAITPIPAHVNTSHFVHASWARHPPSPDTRSRWRARYERLVTSICAWCERRAYRSAGRVVAVSEIVRDALVRDVGVDGTRVRVVHTGVNTSEFRPRAAGESSVLRGSNGLPADAFLILFVGDAKSGRKNLDLALNALARLDHRFRLVVIGDARGGPYPERARRLGVAGRVRFAGPRRDVAACLRDANAILCASHYEPASLVLLEAMATGVPVIATRLVGNAIFLEHGRNGFVLEAPDDTDGAVGALGRLADDADLRTRIGQAARETALRLSWSRMGEAYETVYREVRARPHRSPRYVEART